MNGAPPADGGGGQACTAGFRVEGKEGLGLRHRLWEQGLGSSKMDVEFMKGARRAMMDVEQYENCQAGCVGPLHVCGRAQQVQKRTCIIKQDWCLHSTVVVRLKLVTIKKTSRGVQQAWLGAARPQPTKHGRSGAPSNTKPYTYTADTQQSYTRTCKHAEASAGHLAGSSPQSLCPCC